jgi:hypothetical protein
MCHVGLSNLGCHEGMRQSKEKTILHELVNNHENHAASMRVGNPSMKSRLTTSHGLLGTSNGCNNPRHMPGLGFVGILGKLEQINALPP